MYLSGRGTTRAEDGQGTPTQSHIAPSILVYEEKLGTAEDAGHVAQVADGAFPFGSEPVGLPLLPSYK